MNILISLIVLVISFILAHTKQCNPEAKLVKDIQLTSVFLLQKYKDLTSNSEVNLKNGYLKGQEGSDSHYFILKIFDKHIDIHHGCFIQKDVKISTNKTHITIFELTGKRYDSEYCKPKLYFSMQGSYSYKISGNYMTL